MIAILIIGFVVTVYLFTWSLCKAAADMDKKMGLK